MQAADTLRVERISRGVIRVLIETTYNVLNSVHHHAQ